MALQDVFEDFKKSKAVLKKVHHDTVKYFDEIVRKLSDRGTADIAEELCYKTYNGSGGSQSNLIFHSPILFFHSPVLFFTA